MNDIMNTWKEHWQGGSLLPEESETGMPHVAILPGEQRNRQVLTDKVKRTNHNENNLNKMVADDEKETIIQNADEVSIFLVSFASILKKLSNQSNICWPARPFFRT